MKIELKEYYQIGEFVFVKMPWLRDFYANAVFKAVIKTIEHEIIVSEKGYKDTIKSLWVSPIFSTGEIDQKVYQVKEFHKKIENFVNVFDAEELYC